MSESAILVLADGSVFHGVALGARGITVGEVVFNTAMTGYQEMLTDPSYQQQLIAFTYPHIGNVGANAEDTESQKIQAAGLIIRDLPLLHSSFRAEISLNDYLVSQQIVGIAEIDTRRLTRILRDKGAQTGCILSGEDLSLATAQAKIAQFGAMNGKALAKQVSCHAPFQWTQDEWQLTPSAQAKSKADCHIVALDFGAKHNILRMLSQRAQKLTVVPADTSAEAILALQPDGIFLSNGPGDPEVLSEIIATIQQLLVHRIPIFGICLGHQLLALAVGAKTRKMAFGHHGANHPVLDLDSQKVLITSQNHGFEVDETTLPASVRVTHRSLFDQSVQGIALTHQAAFSFQGHPEAAPGPQDVAYLFDQFITQIQQHLAQGAQVFPGV